MKRDQLWAGRSSNVRQTKLLLIMFKNSNADFNDFYEVIEKYLSIWMIN